MSTIYNVKKTDKPFDICVNVPGSKSITNRALFMAALEKGNITINGALFSDDSRAFLDCLISLGYDLEINEDKKSVRLISNGYLINNKDAIVNVRSAGTAARFITTLLALTKGNYIIESSQQMKNRPMKPLFDVLIQLGANISYLEKEGHLPIRIENEEFVMSNSNKVDIDISKSTQFLSALIMIAPHLKNGLEINITSEKKDGSYIRITRKMLEEFGYLSEKEDSVYTIKNTVLPEKKDFVYNVEPDVSAACYFYGLAFLTGGKALVKGVHFDSMQGDINFLKLLEKMGAKVKEGEEGIKLDASCLIKNNEVVFDGIEVDMNNYSDQTMTLAAIAPFAKTPTRIFNISHIRLQESDRLKAIVNELTKMGIKCIEKEDEVTIYPGLIKPSLVSTYEDHRMAMAFSLIGTRVEGISIDDYKCCRKTFEEYFEVLDSLY